MQLKRLIYQLWEELDGLNITDDSLFTYDYLKDKIIAMHPSIVKEAYDQRLSLNGFYQTMSCIEVVCEGTSCQIEGITFNSNVKLYKALLPPLVKTIGRSNIRYLGADGLAGQISLTSLDGFISSDGARFTSHNPMATIVGDVAILKNLPTRGMNLLYGVFVLADPTRACDWPSNDEEEFPTPSVPRLLIAVKRDILTAIGRPDLIHDSQIAMQPQTKQVQPQEEE